MIDSGDGVTHVVPVVDGFAFPHLTKRLNVAGRHVTSHLVDLLLRRGYAFNRSADMDTVRQARSEAKRTPTGSSELRRISLLSDARARGKNPSHIHNGTLTATHGHPNGHAD